MAPTSYNRTVPNIRSILTKAGGNLATKGAVAFQFHQKGLLLFEPGTPEDQVLEAAISAGAEDVQTKEDGSIEVIALPEHYEAVRQACEAANLPPTSAALTMIPQVTVPLDAEKGKKLLNLIDKLEDDDDVQAVHTNAEIPDDALS